MNINKIILKLGSYPLQILGATWFTAPNGGVSVSPLNRLVSGFMNLISYGDDVGDIASNPIQFVSLQHLFIVHNT